MALTKSDVSFATFLSVNFGDSVGSGFRIRHNNHSYIITAKHVIYNNDTLLSDLYIKSQNYFGKLDDAYSAKVNLSEANVYMFGNSDIVLVKLDEQSEFHIESEGTNIISATLVDLLNLEDIKLAANILFIGFPSSLTVDKFYEVDRPLLRTGIVAGINLTNRTFVVDSLAFYGVSGGPIVQINHDNTIQIIGIVSRYVPFITEWRNKHERAFSRQDFFNSGYAVCEPLDNIINIINTIIL